MNTTRVYEFLVLSKVLSYSKAAKALYISQSVLSRHIQDLEEELGTSLFTRTTHGVTLTEAGRVFAREAQGLLDKCDRTLSLLRSQSRPTSGSVRVALGLELSYSGHIRQFLQQFSRMYPEIGLTYKVLPGSTPVRVLQEYDVVFTPCAYPELPASVRQLFVRHHDTHLILPPNHAMISKPAVYLHQLAGETVIVPHAGEPFGPYARNWMLAEKATRGQVSNIKVDNLSTALLLVSMGKGVCIAPRYVKNLMSQDTFDVTISDRNCKFDEYLYYNDTGNGAAELFFEEFAATLRK